MSVSPDLTGFREAQRRLRDAFGQDVTFHWPPTQTWPEGTRLDPESGQPYDPTVKPVASAPRSAVVKADVASSPGRKDSTDTTAFGELEVGDVLLIVNPEDALAVAGATRFELPNGERYAVRATRDDGIGGVDRHLVFGERE